MIFEVEAEDIPPPPALLTEALLASMLRSKAIALSMAVLGITEKCLVMLCWRDLSM